MQTLDEYNVKLTSANVNNLMQRVLDDISYNEKHNVHQTLTETINRNMRELAQILDEEEITEIKQYEYSCDIELYPMVQYVDANTSEEAMELMEQIINDESFLHDLDCRDFHCTGANIVQSTKEFKNYINKNKESNNG
tara:strand:+ start:314 stop:727 length:414 start_codon:yes stop_codon:yes gene_type:complete